MEKQLTNEEIVEGNKLIAIFEGYKFYPKDSINNIQGVYRKKGKLGALHTGFKYHKSWDELNPVVDKISEISKHGVAHDYWKDAESDIRIFREPIQLTYKMVIEFIKWHNTKPQ